jgi:spore germination protein
MNYDLFGPWNPEVVGPTSTAPWARERMAHLAGEVPKHKIVMGLPTYSLDWDIDEPARSRQVYDTDFIAAREKDSANGRHWIPHWDVSVVRYTDADDHIHLLYITDARSTRSHLETTDILDLAGVCFWALWGDDPAIWECVRRHLGRA